MSKERFPDEVSEKYKAMISSSILNMKVTLEKAGDLWRDEDVIDIIQKTTLDISALSLSKPELVRVDRGNKLVRTSVLAPYRLNGKTINFNGDLLPVSNLVTSSLEETEELLASSDQSLVWYSFDRYTRADVVDVFNSTLIDPKMPSKATKHMFGVVGWNMSQNESRYIPIITRPFMESQSLKLEKGLHTFYKELNALLGPEASTLVTQSDTEREIAMKLFKGIHIIVDTAVIKALEE